MRTGLRAVFRILDIESDCFEQVDARLADSVTPDATLPPEEVVKWLALVFVSFEKQCYAFRQGGAWPDFAAAQDEREDAIREMVHLHRAGRRGQEQGEEATKRPAVRRFPKGLFGHDWG
eukprot:3698700-Prymnesium_polylepis.1